MWRHRFVSVRCLTSVYVYRVWYNRMPYWDGIWHVLVNFPFFCYTLIQWVFADGWALQGAKPSVNTQLIFQYNSILVVRTSVNFVLSLWICRGVPGPFRNRPDVSSIGPMPGRFWHIAAYLQGCLDFVCYVELFWCYVFFVCTASPVSTATECRNKIVTKTSLRYLSHSAVTLIVKLIVNSNLNSASIGSGGYTNLL